MFEAQAFELTGQQPVYSDIPVASAVDSDDSGSDSPNDDPEYGPGTPLLGQETYEQPVLLSG